MLTPPVQRLITAKKQLTWINFLVFIISKVTGRLFQRYAIPSYSQFGEDRIIGSFFADKEKGFYVDVGCNHPVAYSNTWKLYIRGWCGICIDANADLISEFQKVRPMDTALQKVISDKKKEVEFYYSKTSHLISGIGSKTEGFWKRTSENSNVVKCESVTLCDVLTEYNAPQEFDLLNIDVEGEELPVLNSLNFDKYTPQLITVEMHDFDIALAAENAVYKLLVERGYSMVSYLQPTGFFSLKKDDG
ncbi:MAG: FkbM family methyltransferase [Arenicella sp.]|nr:FkbM family methyltransferase [Arenicella sp.]